MIAFMPCRLMMPDVVAPASVVHCGLADALAARGATPTAGSSLSSLRFRQISEPRL